MDQYARDRAQAAYDLAMANRNRTASGGFKLADGTAWNGSEVRWGSPKTTCSLRYRTIVRNANECTYGVRIFNGKAETTVSRSNRFLLGKTIPWSSSPITKTIFTTSQHTSVCSISLVRYGFSGLKQTLRGPNRICGISTSSRITPIGY